MKRLTINGQVADISELPSAISFKYVDIIDGLSNRYSPFTSGITIPYTARNKSIFGYSDVVGGSKKVNPNLIRDGYRLFNSTTNVNAIQTSTLTLTSGRNYTFSVKGSRVDSNKIALVFIDRIIAGGSRWVRDLSLPIAGVADINSLSFICPETGTYNVGFFFQSSSLNVVEWVMLQEGSVYIDQNTQFKQTAEESVANLENLLEDSVQKTKVATSDIDYLYIEATLVHNKLYTFSIASATTTSGTNYQVRIRSTDGSTLKWATFTPGTAVQSFTFRIPSTGTYEMRLYTGIYGSSYGTATYNNIMLQYGPFSTKWYKYGITPTVIPISAERGVSNVDMFIGGMKVIDQGSLTVDSMDADGYHCTVNSRNTLVDAIEALKVEDIMDDIQGDANIFNGYTLFYLLPTLSTGANGVMLARDLLDDITSEEWIIFQKMISGEERIGHWVWFSLKKLFTTLETALGVSFYFTENGQLVDINTSSLVDTYFTKLWTPGYAYYVQIDPSTGVCTLGKNIASTSQFYFGTEDVVPRSTFKAFGNKTAWEMVKIVSNMFCCGLKVSAKDSTIIFYPLNEIKYFDSIDLSGRLTERPEKIPFTEGYTSTSRIRFTVSDNAPEDYNEIVLTSPKLPVEVTDVYTLELLVPGIYYNAILDDNVFKMNMASNDMLNTVPVILYQNNETEQTLVRYSSEAGVWQEYGAYLEKLRMLDLSTFHTGLQSWITKGLTYNVKIAISIYDYLKLQPYRLIRIKELGGDYYLNKIDKWNPDKEAKMQLVKADTAVVKVTPTLTWNTPSDISYGTALSSTQLNCTANVAGTFTYTPAVGEVLNAGTHTLSVTFVPTDKNAYKIAVMTVSILVNQIAIPVTWATPSAITYGTVLGGAQLNATANVPGTFVYNPPAGTILNTGTHTLSVTFTPLDTTNYIGDTESVSLVVNKATPVITWANPSAITYGTVLGGAQLNATSNVPGTFVYSPAAGATLNAGTQSLGVIFTPTDTAHYNGNTKSVSLVVNKATPNITWIPTLNRILDGEQWQAGHLNATGSVAGVMTYNYAIGGALLAVGDTLDIAEGVKTIYIYATLTPTDSANYDTRTTPSPGQLFKTVAPYLSFNKTINQLDGLVEYYTPGIYDDDIVLHASINFQITVQSGAGFVFKIYNTQILFPYNGSRTTSIVVTGIFSQVDKSQVLLITPESGSGLNPITLTCHYYKEPPL